MGSKTQTTVSSGDPVAQRMAAEAAVDQQRMAREMYERYWEMAAPYEEAVLQSNQNLVPFNETLSRIQMETETALTPLRAQAQSLGLQETMRDLQQGRAVKDQLRDNQLSELRDAKQVSSQFFAEAQRGVNVKDRIQQASADISQQFGMAREELGRTQNPFRRGNALGTLASEEAKARVAGITQTRRGAEQENFQRLGMAKEAAGRATGLPGTGDLMAGSMNAMGQMAGQVELGNYQMTNPVSAAQGFYGGANQAIGVSGANARQTTTQSGGGGGLGGFLGQAAGIGLGTFMGGLSFCRRDMKREIVPVGTIQTRSSGPLILYQFVYTDYARLTRPASTRPGRCFGFMADEVAKVYPEAVIFDNEGTPDQIDYGLLQQELVLPKQAPALQEGGRA